jgi:hypothetical protein
LHRARELAYVLQPGMVTASVRRLVPASRRRAREDRLAREHSADPIPGLRRQRLHMDRSWHDLARRGGGGVTPRRRLLLVHVPKTGGTSLRLMVEEHVAPERVFVSTGAYQFADHSIRSLAGYEVFVGHNFLEPLYLLPTDPWVTVLVARDPVDWWRSRYTYRRTRALAAGRHDHPLVRMSMGAWLDGSSDAVISNGQTSWLLARARLMFDSPHLPTTAVAGTGADLADRPEAALDLLDRLLDRVTVLGRTDDLQQVYERACRAMGWRPRRSKALRDNVSDHDADLVRITDTQESRLRNLNVLDQYLYDRAGTRRVVRLPRVEPDPTREPAVEARPRSALEPPLAAGRGLR